MEPEPLPKDDISSGIRMQSTTEPGRRNRSRIPLDVKFENLQELFTNVSKSARTASAISHEPSSRAIADLLRDDRVRLRRWSKNLDIMMPEAESYVNALRILGKLGGPVAARLVAILEGIEKDLRELSTYLAEYHRYG